MSERTLNGAFKTHESTPGATLQEQLRWQIDVLEDYPFSTGELLKLAADELDRASIAISEASSFALVQRTAETLDAERYRYLRSAAGQYAGDECGPMVCSGCGDNFEYLRGEEVDQEVDEAMAAWKAAGCPLPDEAPK